MTDDVTTTSGPGDDVATVDQPAGATTEPGGLAAEPDNTELDTFLDDVYAGQERISQAEIERRAVAAELPAELLTRINALPEGEYAVDEVADLLGGAEW